MGLKTFFNSKPDQLIPSALIMITMALYGAGMIIVGNSLLDLQIKIQESFAVTSKIIVVRSVGYYVGAFLAGVLENYYNPYVAMFAFNFTSGLFLIILPLLTSFYLMAGGAFVLGFCMAVVDLDSPGAHTIVFNLWKENSGPPVQAMMTAFSIGSLLGPLLVRPFMLPSSAEIEDEDAPSRHLQFGPEDVKIFWAFVPVGVGFMVLSLPFLRFYFKHRAPQVAQEEQKETDDPPVHQPSSTLRQYIPVLIVAVLYHLGNGTAALISYFTPAYGAKSELKMSKKDTNLLVSAFWIAMLVARLVSIFLSTYFDARRLMSLVVFGCLLSDAFLLLHGTSSVACFCISTIAYCIFRSPLAGILFAILNQCFTPSGRQTSIIFLVGILGEAVHPAIVSQFMDDYPNIFIYYIGILIIFQQIFLIALPPICRKLFKKDPEFEDETTYVRERRMSRLNSLIL